MYVNVLSHMIAKTLNRLDTYSILHFFSTYLSYILFIFKLGIYSLDIFYYVSIGSRTNQHLNCFERVPCSPPIRIEVINILLIVFSIQVTKQKANQTQSI